MSERDNDQDESEGGGRPGLPLDPLRVWGALRSRWQIILAASIIGAFLGAFVAKKWATQEFSAHAVVTWEANATTDPVERTTIIESMTLPSNLDEVKRRLKIEEMPNRELIKFITVSSQATSNNIHVEATWATAEGAAQLANTLVNVFLEARKRNVRSRLDAAVARYRESVAEAKKRQEAAVGNYDKFRKEAGFNDISQERELAIQQYAELMAQADGARSRADQAKTELDSIKGEGSAPAPTAALTEVDQKQAAADTARLPLARSELEAARRQYNDDHPTVRRLDAEITALEARIRARSSDPNRRRERVEAAARSAEAKRKAADEFQAKLKARLDKLSDVEGKAAVLLGEMKVSDEALEKARQLLATAEFEAAQPIGELRLSERAISPEYATKSPRKRIAIASPILFGLLAALGILGWTFRRLDVCTPKEAAFWSGAPVVGASTWPRDPDMLASLMHDLDDFAPHAEGVTLIVGLSLSEAHLARKVAEWDGHRAGRSIDDPARMLTAGTNGSLWPLAAPGSVGGGDSSRNPDATSGQMQILTLTGPVPAQALRRAARLAARVLVVVTSGKHSFTQMTKIKGRLGRDKGIGVLLVGLEKDFALVRDRVGDVTEFWQSTAARGA